VASDEAIVTVATKLSRATVIFVVIAIALLIEVAMASLYTRMRW